MSDHSKLLHSLHGFSGIPAEPTSEEQGQNESQTNGAQRSNAAGGSNITAQGSGSVALAGPPHR
ncbi:hypothetical protein B0J17DRAFT_772192 [Rhizoctonia solani]|nr:hypothetical protein B0J17DRAFT_772192 [Rhizoctonia solani]